LHAVEQLFVNLVEGSKMSNVSDRFLERRLAKLRADVFLTGDATEKSCAVLNTLIALYKRQISDHDAEIRALRAMPDEVVATPERNCGEGQRSQRIESA
jgi:hypothetical protein